MIELLSKSTDELKEILAQMDEKSYVAAQLKAWLNKGTLFSDMNNLSKDLRAKLEESFDEGYAKVIEKHTSKDGTIKYLLSMHGGGRCFKWSPGGSCYIGILHAWFSLKILSGMCSRDGRVGPGI